jgi:hypothetical protein
MRRRLDSFPLGSVVVIGDHKVTTIGRGRPGILVGTNNDSLGYWNLKDRLQRFKDDIDEIIPRAVSLFRYAWWYDGSVAVSEFQQPVLHPKQICAGPCGRPAPHDNPNARSGLSRMNKYICALCTEIKRLS